MDEQTATPAESPPDAQTTENAPTAENAPTDVEFIIDVLHFDFP